MIRQSSSCRRDGIDPQRYLTQMPTKSSGTPAALIELMKLRR
jgi:hypothetical protein